MAILVPGVGFSGSRTIVAAVNEYISLGPVPVDSWIERIEFLLDISGAAGATGISLGVVVSKSDDANAAAMAAGQSLVHSSEAGVDGKRALQFFSSINSAAAFRIYPGYHVQSGPVWVLIGLGGDPAPAVFHVNVSMKTLRRVVEAGA